MLAGDPYLAPALEPALCFVPHGLAGGLAQPVMPYRADQLRCVGNGVDPHVAACAFITLMIELLTLHPALCERFMETIPA